LSPNVEGTLQRSRRRPLRIAVMVGQLPRSEGGGTERQAMRAAVELARRGHCVWVLARGPVASRYQSDGVWIVERPELRLTGAPSPRVPALRFAWDLIQGLGDLQRTNKAFDVLLSYHTFNAGLLGSVASVATRTPQVLWIRSGEEFHRDGSLRGRLLAPPVWLLAQTILVQSPTLAAEFTRAVASLVPRALADRIQPKVQILPNGLDLPTDVGEPSDRRELLFVGRLHPGKGLKYLLDALPLIPGARLTVVGDGSDRPHLEERARGLPVAFVGSKSLSEMANLYRQTSIVVFPSTLEEGLPNVVLESLAFGRPVVATRKGGVVDVVHDGVNGALVSTLQPAVLASTINPLLDAHDKLVRMGAAARETAKAYAWDALLPRLEAVLAESAASQRHPPARFVRPNNARPTESS
jgi:glycosyltransferase involved in cell wall biosynthesis